MLILYICFFLLHYLFSIARDYDLLRYVFLVIEQVLPHHYDLFWVWQLVVFLFMLSDGDLFHWSSFCILVIIRYMPIFFYMLKMLYRPWHNLIYRRYVLFLSLMNNCYVIATYVSSLNVPCKLFYISYINNIMLFLPWKSDLIKETFKYHLCSYFNFEWCPLNNLQCLAVNKWSP